jgi:hypothetical protein
MPPADVHYCYEPAWDRQRTITGSYVQSQQSRWFDELTSRKLRRPAHCNVAELEADIASPLVARVRRMSVRTREAELPSNGESPQVRIYPEQ